MRILKAILLGLLLVLVLTFSAKNSAYVRIQYFDLLDHIEIPLFVLTLLSLSLGVFAGAILDLFYRHRLRRMVRRQQKLMDQLQREHRSLVIGSAENLTT